MSNGKSSTFQAFICLLRKKWWALPKPKLTAVRTLPETRQSSLHPLLAAWFPAPVLTLRTASAPKATKKVNVQGKMLVARNSLNLIDMKASSMVDMDSLTFTEVLKYLREEQKMQLKVFSHVRSGESVTFYRGEHQRKYDTLRKLIFLIELLDVEGFAQILRIGRERVRMFRAMESSMLFNDGQ